MIPKWIITLKFPGEDIKTIEVLAATVKEAEEQIQEELRQYIIVTELK